MRGFTLLELVVVLAVAALLVGTLPPRFSLLRDRMAVRGAREAAVGIVARARARALLAGGAQVEATEEPSLLTVRTPGGEEERLDLVGGFGVRLEIPGPARRATLRFDALGVGRMASRTLRFRRGEAESALSVSSYGRVRRP